MTLLLAGIALAALAGFAVWCVTERPWHYLVIAALTVPLLPMFATTITGDVSAHLPGSMFSDGPGGKDEEQLHCQRRSDRAARGPAGGRRVWGGEGDAATPCVSRSLRPASSAVGAARNSPPRVCRLAFRKFRHGVERLAGQLDQPLAALVGNGGAAVRDLDVTRSFRLGDPCVGVGGIGVLVLDAGAGMAALLVRGVQHAQEELLFVHART